MIGKTISLYPPEADPPLAGKILEKIDEGGMGEVYFVKDAALHRKAAIKLYRYCLWF